MLKKIIIGLAILLVLIICAVAALFYIVGDAAKITEYEFGADKVASVNAVIGETRKVSGVSSGTSGGVQQKQYVYESASMLKDLTTYSRHLMSNGWIVVKSFDLNTGNGEAQFATQSVDEGKILVMSIAFEPDKYAIKISKFEGQVNRD